MEKFLNILKAIGGIGVAGGIGGGAALGPEMKPVFDWLAAAGLVVHGLSTAWKALAQALQKKT